MTLVTQNIEFETGEVIFETSTDLILVRILLDSYTKFERSFMGRWDHECETYIETLKGVPRKLPPIIEVEPPSLQKTPGVTKHSFLTPDTSQWINNTRDTEKARNSEASGTRYGEHLEESWRVNAAEDKATSGCHFLYCDVRLRAVDNVESRREKCERF
ncbi:Hypothetical predicted protein [Octopus vulgaris]|uniref:Uncharacterized protein n=1 Tax=Octopus vulgaris TaxID=6645 RepID=A0AA36BEG9_OCTVU|nr:Hypothetical predicted protein [Octopus vulgaris]